MTKKANPVTKPGKNVDAVLEVLMNKMKHFEDKIEALKAREEESKAKIDTMCENIERLIKDRRKHDKLGDIQCKECDSSFENMKLLKKHLTLTHIKTDRCKDCDKLLTPGGN